MSDEPWKFFGYTELALLICGQLQCGLPTVTARPPPFLPVNDFQWLSTVAPPHPAHGQIASSLVLRQPRLFWGIGLGAIFAAAILAESAADVKVLHRDHCEWCESVLCFKSYIWRGQTTGQLPRGCRCWLSLPAYGGPALHSQMAQSRKRVVIQIQLLTFDRQTGRCAGLPLTIYAVRKKWQLFLYLLQ